MQLTRSQINVYFQKEETTLDVFCTSAMLKISKKKKHE